MTMFMRRKDLLMTTTATTKPVEFDDRSYARIGSTVSGTSVVSSVVDLVLVRDLRVALSHRPPGRMKFV